jgi:rhamnose utilization protein RhaD (predicted bifunctional aldolase and dehydrogenase)
VGRDVRAFVKRYQNVFVGRVGNLEDLGDLTPRIIIDPALGLLAVGSKPDEADLAATIFRHSTKIILQAEQLGGWQPAPEFDLSQSECGEITRTDADSNSEFAGEIALILRQRIARVG